MARGRDHFSVRLRRKKTEREKERKGQRRRKYRIFYGALTANSAHALTLMLSRYGANAKPL